MFGDYENKQGRWSINQSKKRHPWIAALIVAIFICGALLVAGSANSTRNGSSVGDGQGKENPDYGCKKVGESHGVGEWDCTDAKIAPRKSELDKKQEVKTALKSWMAFVTRYTPRDSCHYPKDGKCLTASGRFASEGLTAACPYFLKLGTWIEVNGKKYRCDDRYAKWLDEKRELPTVDLFGGDYDEAIKWGKKKILVYETSNAGLSK